MAASPELVDRVGASPGAEAVEAPGCKPGQVLHLNWLEAVHSMVFDRRHPEAVDDSRLPLADIGKRAEVEVEADVEDNKSYKALAARPQRTGAGAAAGVRLRPEAEGSTGCRCDSSCWAVRDR